MADHPVRIVLDDDLRRSRLTVFLRLLLAIPHLVALLLFTIGAFFVAIAGWFAALATGRMPTGLRNLGAFSVRYHSQTNAYVFIVTDAYPHASPPLQPPPGPEPAYADPFQPLPEAV